MSQHDFIIDNQFFPQTRADINAALQAIATNSSGATEPAIPTTNPVTDRGHQWWYDTTNYQLKIRNTAGTGWTVIATLDAAGANVVSITTQGLTLGSTAILASADEINTLNDLTRGSLVYGNASGATARLAKGSAGTVLTSDGTDISWAAAAGGGGTGFIESVDINNVTYVDFDLSGDAGSYDNYVFFLQNVKPMTDVQNFHMQIRRNGQSSFDAGGTDYKHGAVGANGGNAGYMQIKDNTGNADTDGGTSGVVYCYGPHLAQYTIFNSFLTGFNNTNVPNSELRFGARVSQTDVDAVRFKTSSGNYKSGTITCYGFKNS